MNAIADAIPGNAAAHMEMPATPQKIWAACRKIGWKIASLLLTASRAAQPGRETLRGR